MRTLLERHRASSFAITIPTHGGKGGHPIFITAQLLPELADIEEDTQGLKAVVRRHADATRAVESVVGQERKSGVAARMSALRVRADEFSGKADIAL